VDIDKQLSASAAANSDDSQPPSIGDLDRIVLTCQAEPVLVDVIRIENPQAALPEQRLRKSPEYLRARVRPRLPRNSEEPRDEQVLLEQLCRQAWEEYRQVQELYQNNSHVSDLPSFAQDRLADAFDAPYQDCNEKEAHLLFASHKSFWPIATAWQILCNTVREGHQMSLNANRNELLVGAALKQGGPLKLPIHVEDVDPSVRKLVNAMEEQAQCDWLSLQLDPCLDFQALLTLSLHFERVQYLTDMMRRERKRFSTKLLQRQNKPERPTLDLPTTEPAEQETPRGAWFNDEYW